MLLLPFLNQLFFILHPFFLQNLFPFLPILFLLLILSLLLLRLFRLFHLLPYRLNHFLLLNLFSGLFLHLLFGFRLHLPQLHSLRRLVHIVFLRLVCVQSSLNAVQKHVDRVIFTEIRHQCSCQINCVEPLLLLGQTALVVFEQ